MDVPQPATQKYHHFEETHGALLKLPETINGIKANAVGTFHCQTCLCVCVKFKDGQIFIAHMVGFTTLDTPYVDKEAEFLAQWTVDLEKGKQLQEKVIEQLKLKFEPQMKDQATEAFVVCPALYKYFGETCTGRYILAALKEFFSPIEVEKRDGHGFVAGPENQTVLFQWKNSSRNDRGKSSAKRPEEYGWEPAHPLLNPRVADMDGPWRFMFHNGQWKISGQEA